MIRRYKQSDVLLLSSCVKLVVTSYAKLSPTPWTWLVLTKCLEYGLPYVVILSEYMAPLRVVNL